MQEAGNTEEEGLKQEERMKTTTDMIRKIKAKQNGREQQLVGQ